MAPGHDKTSLRGVARNGGDIELPVRSDNECAILFHDKRHWLEGNRVIPRQDGIVELQLHRFAFG